MKKHFNGREVFIGLDWPILAGRNELWVTVVILVPIMLIFAMILPGNTVLPFAGIINLSFVVAALLLTGANLLRMLVLGFITTPVFLYGATYFAPIITNLAKSTGTVKVHAGQQLSWSTFEGPDFRLFFAKAFTGEWWAIGLSILWLVGFIWLYIDQNKAKLPSQRYVLAGSGVTEATSSNVSTPVSSASSSDTDLDDLDNMDFSRTTKPSSDNSNSQDELDDLDGMNFSNISKDNKR